MFLSELSIENFRMFGEHEHAILVPLRLGLTALVGENDTGKTAIVDALRLALGTRDQEYFRIDDADFHQPLDGSARRTEIRIRCKFANLASRDIAAFAEYLSYEDRDGVRAPVLYVNWRAALAAGRIRQKRHIVVEVRSGLLGDGPQFDAEARLLLCAAYLRPLRDAERALSAGRGSRLSQILQHTKEVTESGEDYDPKAGPPTDPQNLSVLGIGDYANALLGDHKGIQGARTRLNRDYLNNLSFRGDRLEGSVSVSGSKGDAHIRRRQLLEKLELELRDEGVPEPPSSRGLGSNNLLFIACELLLLGSEDDGFPLLLIEEPEAHLHPQRQLRLVQFLQRKASEARPDSHQIQVIVTTHSPNLASAIALDNLVLLHGRKAFSLASGQTQLNRSDYGFLERFLDVTKANLFFARGLVVVEGDAENILLPTLARLIGRDFTENGVSIVNVGGIGLRRFARIFQRKQVQKESINLPVACVTDFDVMPDCAPQIIGRVAVGEELPNKNDRHWRVKADFTEQELTQRRQDIYDKASGQHVETFVADLWTLEYDLAYFGLARAVWFAAQLAKADERINSGHTTPGAVVRDAARVFASISDQNPTQEELASHVYALFAQHSGISKATAAQYLSCLLERRQRKGQLSSESLRSALPPYLVSAIDHVTRQDTDDALP